MRFFLVAVFTFLITGCGSIAQGVLYPDLETLRTNQVDKVNIIIYRPSRITGSGDRMNIFANGKSYGALKPLGYMLLNLNPGSINLHTDTSAIDRQLKINATPGEKRFFRTEFSNYVMAAAWDLVEISKSEAEKDLIKLRESTESPNNQTK